MCGVRAAVVCLALAAGAVIGVGGCGAASGASSAPAADRSGTVWLCRPGLANDPCTSDLTATVVGPAEAGRIKRAAPARHPRVDCFYVYPTVSSQQTTNANLQSTLQERLVAVMQASRFSTVCRVYAPMYPQLTLHAILSPGGITPQGAATAYLGLASAFHDYLAHDNHGRGIVFIGHSQGASLLIALLRREVDPSPSLRRRLVVRAAARRQRDRRSRQAPRGRLPHIPACRRGDQTGCVVAYSSFDSRPPADSKFGRVGPGVGPARPRARRALQVLCVNPASLAGGSGTLTAVLHDPGPRPGSGARHAPVARRRRGCPIRTSTPPAAPPRAARPGSRSSHDGRARDRRPVVADRLGPTWGLHVYDVNLALGNLAELVRREIRAYR